MDDSGCVLKCDYAIKPLNGENSHNIFGVPYFQTINLKPESFLLAKNCGSFEKKKASGTERCSKLPGGHLDCSLQIVGPKPPG